MGALIPGIALPAQTLNPAPLSAPGLLKALVHHKLTPAQAVKLNQLKLESARKLNPRAVLVTPPHPKAAKISPVKKWKLLTPVQLKTNHRAALEHLAGLVHGDNTLLHNTLTGISNWSNNYYGTLLHNHGFGHPVSLTRPITLVNLPVSLWGSLCEIEGGDQMGAPATTYSPSTPNESVPTLLSNGYADDGAISTPLQINGGVDTEPGWMKFWTSSYNLPPGTPSLQTALSQYGISLNGAYELSSTQGIFQTLCVFMDSGKSQFVTQGPCVDFGGNHGHWEMKVQILRMNAQGVPQFDGQGQPIFDDAGAPATMDLFGPNSGMPGAAASGQMVMNFLSASASFGQIANVCRVGVRCFLGDTRVGPGAIDQTPSNINGNGRVTGPGYQTSFPTPFTTPVPGNVFNPAWNYEAPFEVDVIPTEFLQVKYMPLCIIYAPPGDGSSASYQISSNYTDKFTFSDTWAGKYTNTNVNVSTFALNLGANLSDVVNASDGYTSEWDHTTSAVNGSTTIAQNVYSMAYFNSIQLPAQLGGLPSNDSEPVVNEPFWGDQFVLIPHAQFAVWNYEPSFGGDGPSISYLQLIGMPQSFYPASVGQLADCEVASACGLTCVLNNTLTGAGADALSSYEAARLLSLDPFYVDQWQGWPGVTGYNPMKPSTDTGGRAALIASTAFGAQISSGGVTANNKSGDLTQIQQTTSQTSDETLTRQVIFNSSVENDYKQNQTTGVGENIDFSPVKLNIGGTASTGSTATTITELDFTQLQSPETTIANTVQVSGSLGNSGSQISVNVYEDLLYGGMMFQDINEKQPQPTPTPNP